MKGPLLYLSGKLAAGLPDGAHPPHLNWPDRVGQVTPVHVFTFGDEVVLRGKPGKTGSATLKVSSENLPDATLEITLK